MKALKENDVVALLTDLPQHGLHRGDVGTVIEVFAESRHRPSGYIVEFVNESGGVYAQADISDTSQIMPLRFRREAA
jgi:hypothetical protein